MTVPGISQISRYDMDHWGDYWRFTTLSARKLFAEVFKTEHVDVQAYGNVLTAVAFLHGFVIGEIREEELSYRDPDYEVVIGVLRCEGIALSSAVLEFLRTATYQQIGKTSPHVYQLRARILHAGATKCVP